MIFRSSFEGLSLFYLFWSKIGFFTKNVLNYYDAFIYPCGLFRG